MAHCELLGGSLPIISNKEEAKMLQQKSESKWNGRLMHFNIRR